MFDRYNQINQKLHQLINIKCTSVSSPLTLNGSRSDHPTYLIPLGVSGAHLQDTQGVGLGSDVSVQEILTGHSQLHLGHTLSSHVWQEEQHRQRETVMVLCEQHMFQSITLGLLNENPLALRCGYFCEYKLPLQLKAKWSRQRFI